MVYAPHLPHLYGRSSIYSLAIDLERKISRRFAPNVDIDILGFSMGGLVSRIWIQELSGFRRTKRFFCVGSPQKGTITSQIVPKYLMPGIADMKIGSDLITSLKKNSYLLKKLECKSFYCLYDLMVFPGWQAVLPVGRRYKVPVFTHKSLISHPKGVQYLTKAIV